MTVILICVHKWLGMNQNSVDPSASRLTCVFVPETHTNTADTMCVYIIYVYIYMYNLTIYMGIHM